MTYVLGKDRVLVTYKGVERKDYHCSQRTSPWGIHFFIAFLHKAPYHPVIDI